jgi:hypothetical protein
MVGVEEVRPTAGPLDGFNQWPSLLSGAPAGPRTDMVYSISPVCNMAGGDDTPKAQSAQPSAAIRVGDWKLLAWCVEIAGVYNGTGVGQVTQIINEPSQKDFATGPALFNLRLDPSESTNVASSFPEIVAQLTAELLKEAETSVNPMVWVPPYQGPDYFCANCPLHPATGADVPWGPWL